MTDDREWKAGTGQTIERVYAWIAEEGDGGEGVVAAILPPLPGWTPLFGADRARIESYRQIAEAVARKTGKTVCLKVFSNGVVIDKIEPGG